MPHLPDLEAWAIFAKVAEKGSFSRAAAELGLSHATVSKAIGRLEERLRTTLFNRTTRQLALTESGRLSLERASRILAEGVAVEEEISEEAANPRGLLRMAVTAAFGTGALAPVLPEFLLKYPDIQLDLRLTDRPIDLTVDGFDIVLRFGAVADQSIRITRLFSFRLPLVASPGYYKRHGRPQHPSELENHEALVYTHIASAADWVFDHPTQGRHMVHVQGRVQVNNGLAAVPALVAGLGITLQPEVYVWRELQDGTLEECLTEWTAPPVPLHMLTPPGRTHPARVRVMLEFLKQRFMGMPWARGMER